MGNNFYESFAKQDLIPDFARAIDGEIVYSWDTNVHHLELEINPLGEVSVFYRNRETGAITGAEFFVPDSNAPTATQQSAAPRPLRDG